MKKAKDGEAKIRREFLAAVILLAVGVIFIILGFAGCIEGWAATMLFCLCMLTACIVLFVRSIRIRQRRKNNHAENNNDDVDAEPVAELSRRNLDTANHSDSKIQRNTGMKTAKEMFEYCRTNGFDFGVTRRRGLKHFAVIENALGKNEFVLMSFTGIHNHAFDLKEIEDYAYAVTKRRIIIAKQDLLKSTMQTVDINMVNDITLNLNLGIGTIVVDTIKETFHIKVSTLAAQEIATKLQSIIFDVKEKPAGITQYISASSIADELCKLKDLLDNGAITEDEFNMQKQKILSR